MSYNVYGLRLLHSGAPSLPDSGLGPVGTWATWGPPFPVNTMAARQLHAMYVLHTSYLVGLTL